MKPATLSERLAEASTVLVEHQRKVAELEMAISASSYEEVRVREKLSEASAAAASTRKYIADLELALAAARDGDESAKEQLRVQLEEATEIVAFHEREIVNLTEALHRTQEEERQLREDLSQQLAAATAESEKRKKNVKKLKKALQEAKESEEEANEKLTTQIELANNLVERHEREVAELERALAEAKGEESDVVAELESKLERAMSESQRSKKDVTKLLAMLAATKEEDEKKQSLLQSQLLYATEASNTQSQQLVELQKALDVSVREESLIRARLESKLEAASQSAALRRRDVDALDDALEAAKLGEDALRSKLEEMLLSASEEAIAHSAEVKALEETLRKAHDDHDSLRENLTRELTAANTQVQKTSNRVAELEAALLSAKHGAVVISPPDPDDELKAELEKECERHNATKASLQRLRSEMTELQRQLATPAQPKTVSQATSGSLDVSKPQEVSDSSNAHSPHKVASHSVGLQADLAVLASPRTRSDLSPLAALSPPGDDSRRTSNASINTGTGSTPSRTVDHAGLPSASHPDVVVDPPQRNLNLGFPIRTAKSHGPSLSPNSANLAITPSSGNLLPLRSPRAGELRSPLNQPLHYAWKIDPNAQDSSAAQPEAQLHFSSASEANRTLSAIQNAAKKLRESMGLSIGFRFDAKISNPPLIDVIKELVRGLTLAAGSDTGETSVRSLPPVRAPQSNGVRPLDFSRLAGPAPTESATARLLRELSPKATYLRYHAPNTSRSLSPQRPPALALDFRPQVSRLPQITGRGITEKPRHTVRRHPNRDQPVNFHIRGFR